MLNIRVPRDIYEYGILVLRENEIADLNDIQIDEYTEELDFNIIGHKGNCIEFHYESVYEAINYGWNLDLFKSDLEIEFDVSYYE